MRKTEIVSLKRWMPDLGRASISVSVCFMTPQAGQKMQVAIRDSGGGWGSGVQNSDQ